jgi:hypothetical protein
MGQLGGRVFNPDVGERVLYLGIPGSQVASPAGLARGGNGQTRGRGPGTLMRE